MQTESESPPVPNTARMIDYWLGGSHHLPVDIQGAMAFTDVFPGCQGVFQSLRRFLVRACRHIHAQGIDQFLVLGSGLPTCMNVHEAVPEARVLYTDIDPININLGREILEGVPRAGYTFCDASDPSTLDPAEVARVLGPIKRVGIIFIGVTAFIPDPVLTKMLHALHGWAPEGSYLAIDFDSDFAKDYPRLLALLEAARAPLIMRTKESILPLFPPWKLTEDGLTSVGAWRNESDKDAEGPAFMYGGVLRR